MPPELYDAAEVDGASIWRKIWHVTLPQLRGVIFVMLILQVIATAQVFLEPFLFTGGGPEQLDRHGAAADLPLRVREQPGRQVRRGDGALAHAGDLPGASRPSCTSRPPRSGAPTDDHDGPTSRSPRLPPRRKLDETVEPDADRGILSGHDRKRRSVKVTQTISHVFLFVGLIVVGLGPLLWLAKAAISTTQDTIQYPLAFWPSGIDWANLEQAWVDVEVGKYFFNTIALAFGQWVIGLFIATTGAYVLSVLKPAYARVLQAAILTTLFVPSVVLLVPLFITVARPLIGPSLLNNYLGVWLPTAANAFYILIVKRFFDSLPLRGVRGGEDGWRRPVPHLLVDRAADVAADPRRRLGVHHHRVAEGLPVAEAGAARSGGAAARRAAAEHPVADRVGCDARGARDLDDHPGGAVPGLPAGVPAGSGAGRRGQGLTPSARVRALGAPGGEFGPKVRTLADYPRGMRMRAAVLAIAAALAVAMAGLRGLDDRPRRRPRRGRGHRRPPWTPVDPDAAYVAAVLADMTVAERAATVIMTRVPSTDPAAARASIAASGIGGVILMGGDTQYSVPFSAALNAGLIADPALPPLTAVDQEGGTVARLPDPGPSARALGRVAPDATRAAFAERAALVASAGFDINFGIVADNTPDPSSFLASRVFGPDAGIRRRAGERGGRGGARGGALDPQALPGARRGSRRLASPHPGDGDEPRRVARDPGAALHGGNRGRCGARR